VARGPRREIKQLVVEVTEACNHACMHCYNYWRPRRGDVPVLPVVDATVERGRRVLTRPDFVRLVKKIKRDARLHYIALSGGEPFLRTDLPEIVGDLSDQCEGLVTITNGTLITEERLRRMPERSNFEITLFSAHRETHDAIAGRKSFDRLMETGGIDVVQPDPSRAGGLTGCLRIAERAETLGLALAPHAWSSPVVRAAAMHLCIATPHALMLEFSQHPSPLERLFDTGLELRDGLVAPTDRPGLGVEVDMAAAREFAV